MNDNPSDMIFMVLSILGSISVLVLIGLKLASVW